MRVALRPNHSYRSALEELLQELEPGVKVINEPSHTDFGAPDIVIQRNGMPIGYIECKDLRIDLDDVAKSEQIKRYCSACDNLILTNYLEFRWYRGGEWQDTQYFAEFREGKLHNLNHRNARLRSFLENFLRAAPMDIRSPNELAQVMANLTKEIAAQIRAILDEPGRKTFLWKHKHDLEIELLPTLDNPEFADMYAQTIAYALFAATHGITALTCCRIYYYACIYRKCLAPTLSYAANSDRILQDLEGEVKWAVEQLTTRLAHTQISDVMRDFRGKTRTT